MDDLTAPLDHLTHEHADLLADTSLTLSEGLNGVDDSFDFSPQKTGPSSSESTKFSYGGSMGVPIAGVGEQQTPALGRYAAGEEEEVSEEGMNEEEKVRAKALREERDSLRRSNEHFEQVLDALEGMEVKMKRFEANIGDSHDLLDLFTRISSQAEHTQELLLDGKWEGVTNDIQILAAREQEAAREAQEEAERMEREAQEAATALEVARMKLEEDKRRAASTRGSTRGRGSTSTRGGTGSGSGIGRGGPTVRGVRGTRSRGTVTRGRGTV